MKCTLFTLPFFAAIAAAVPAGQQLEKRADAQGIDVSHFQPNVDWSTVKSNGVTFAYIKATESTQFTDKTFSSKYSGAASAGIIRGAYHFAHPNKGSGAAQAQFFLANGGGWSNDGMTLPGAIDLENEANCPACYGLSPSAMVSWIKDFSNTYQASTGRAPVIYTTTSWWKSCTGNSAEFGNNPLWLAHYSSTIGALPAGWEHETIWQYAKSGSNPGDQDRFHGSTAELRTLASG